MGFLVEAIANIAPYIYAACGILALIQLYRTWQVRAERRQAIFALEREKAVGDLFNIFLSALLMLVVMGFTYFASTTLRTALAAAGALPSQPVEEAPTPTPEVALSALIPTPTFTPDTNPPTPTPAPTLDLPTPAPEVQPPAPVATEPPPPPPPTPQPPAVAPALCPDGRSVILSPGNGAVISGVVSIVGTAQHDQFDYYKLEFAPGQSGQGFNYFDGGENPVSGGLLGNLNSGALANGTYTLQLVVVDSTGNYPQPCRVTVTVQN